MKYLPKNEATFVKACEIDCCRLIGSEVASEVLVVALAIL